MNLTSWNLKYARLKAQLVHGIMNSIDDVKVNGDTENCLSQTVNLTFVGTHGETVLSYLDNKGIFVSTGAACSSGSVSHVLEAIGLDEKMADSTLRFSLGYHNSEDQIDYTVGELQKIIAMLRRR